jgi:hypothetical protein
MVHKHDHPGFQGVGVGLPVLPPSGRLLAAAHKVMVKGQAEVLHIRALLDDH